MEYSTSIGHDATSSGVSEPEFMQLQSSDHPGMVMVSALFTGNNYFAWSRAIKRALTAKMKLDFIEGTAIRPPVNSDEFKRWNRIDSMVTTWVLNCMTKELAESFMYVGSSRELWIELEARYGERCTCNVNKAVDDLNASNHLMQFLVGLNPIYEQARSQILLLEPLPTVTKAYSMLLRMEKQMQVNISNVDNGAAFQARGQNYRKKNFADKKTMVCDHCQKAGHTRDSCFKLLGVPDWYRDMTEQRKKAGGRGKGFIAQMTDEASLTMDESKHSNLADLVRMEMKKYMKEEIPLDPLKINYAQLDNFAVLNWKTPYEVLYDKPPTYSHLRTIGCLCFAIKPEPHISKFDKRASRCVFLGYPSGQKAYRLYDLDTKSTFVSRNVQFRENCFPFATIQTSTSPIPLAVIPLTDDDLEDSTSIPKTSSPPSFSIHPDQHSSTPSPALRRSMRSHNKPAWLNDFICHLPSLDQSPIITSYDSAYMGFVSSLSILQEPRTYRAAASIPHWTEAMRQEIAALEQNHTWEVVPLPPDKSPIGCKWVYKTKLREDGTVERHKARLVAKGYTQIEGVDYTERFSPVAKSVTVRLFLALATAFQWPLHQVDINNAFLHGYLDEEIFMTAPEGYSVPPGHACLLKRSLYGLKQASRQWNAEFTRGLEKFGFRQSGHDHCLFFKALPSGFIGLLVYVDDVLLMAPSLDLISQVKVYLYGLFSIKDLGCARYFLGLQIARSAAGTSITQSKYIHDIIRDYGLQSAKPVATPLPSGIKLHSTSGAPLADPERYRRLVGRLLYLCFTRPDISHSVQQLSQFIQTPCQSHWRAVLHLVRYLSSCPDLGLFFPSSNSLQLQVFCDADWGACLDSRCSLTGFAIFLGPSLISWKTKKQSTVSRSSAEAEYRSMAATSCELQWIAYLLKDFGVSVTVPIPFHCDNQAAIHIMANPVFHERTKHLDIDCHVVRNCYKSGFIQPVFVQSRDQVADLFTKSLPKLSFSGLLGKLGLFAVTPSPTCGGGVGILG
ncbi:UNVERIFIED_CONTAM: Retrovirus-related Pol polyprotein from transposon RE2 [Sesamum indicum]